MATVAGLPIDSRTIRRHQGGSVAYRRSGECYAIGAGTLSLSNHGDEHLGCLGDAMVAARRRQQLIIVSHPMLRASDVEKAKEIERVGRDCVVCVRTTRMVFQGASVYEIFKRRE